MVVNGLNWKWTCTMRLKLQDLWHTTSRGKWTALSFEWQPLLATKPNSTVLIWCIETWEFLIAVVGEINSTDSGYIVQDIEPGKHAANENWARVEIGQRKPTRSGFSCVESGREVHVQNCQNFSCGKVYSFVIGYDDFFFFKSDFAAELIFTPFSQVSSDRKPVKLAGKRSEFSTNQHWNRTSGSYFGTNQHCG